MYKITRFTTTKRGVKADHICFTTLHNGLMRLKEMLRNETYKIIQMSEHPDDAHLIVINSYGTQIRYELERSK